MVRPQVTYEVCPSSLVSIGVLTVTLFSVVSIATDHCEVVQRLECS